MMLKRNYSCLWMLFFVIGIAVGSESYRDYGDETDDRNLQYLREFYKALLRRNSMENLPPIGAPYEHLMIRKSQRSPSLRLRFGRSGPVIPTDILPRPVDSASAFDDN